jgi:hypothetical protein
MQEAELEYVFDKLLCGSLENVLFADDKSHFASAVSSVSFPWSPSTAPRQGRTAFQNIGVLVFIH